MVLEEKEDARKMYTQTMADNYAESHATKQETIKGLREEIGWLEADVLARGKEARRLRKEGERAVQHKASELQDEMEHLMTQQSAQMGRLFAAVKDKNEVQLLEGALLKRTSKGVIRWHTRWCRLTTKHLVCWNAQGRSGKCRLIDLTEVIQTRILLGEGVMKEGDGDVRFEVTKALLPTPILTTVCHCLLSLTVSSLSAHSLPTVCPLSAPIRRRHCITILPLLGNNRAALLCVRSPQCRSCA
jgi:hypothetical protein